jgi:hypothetical protein
MEESDIFVNWLSHAIGLGQSVISRYESPTWICSKISMSSQYQTQPKVGVDNVRIHQLNDKGVKEYIIVEIFRVL